MQHLAAAPYHTSELPYMTRAILATLALSIAALSSAQAEVETYKIDTSHSSVKFSIRHFVAKTTGVFKDFEGTITVDRDDLTKSSVEATIQVASVDTASEKRDKHLQEDDYFDTAKFPTMTFKSSKWEATDDKDEFKVTGKLTIHGVTAEVVLDVELLGFGPGMRGAQLSGWEATTTLDRNTFGVSGGAPAVGAEVDVTINIEAILQK